MEASTERQVGVEVCQVEETKKRNKKGCKNVVKTCRAGLARAFTVVGSLEPHQV